MSERAARIADFLDEAGWRGAEVHALAGDASFRRYHRVRRNGATAMLMDAPPEREDVRPFVRIARHLTGLGLSAPALLHADVAAGLLLIEDFGDETYTRLLDSGADAATLYRLAVDVLIHLHRLPADRALPPGLPAYDRQRLIDEALLLVDWYIPAIQGRPASEAARAAFIAAWHEALEPLLAEEAGLVLRDFHVDNLMRLPARSGVAACGLLDFQDAVTGPGAYDLMSLLEDARRDVAPDLKQEMLDHYRQAMAGKIDVDGFARSFAVLAAQRHCKVIGIFTRLSRRDGKPAYLAHIPRVWRLLEATLDRPELNALAAWFGEFLPGAARHVPGIPAVAAS